jgi:hypothetical protein
MQLILDHIAAVTQPALRKYLAAEKALTDALKSQDAGSAGTARQDMGRIRRSEPLPIPYPGPVLLLELRLHVIGTAASGAEQMRRALVLNGLATAAAA